MRRTGEPPSQREACRHSLRHRQGPLGGSARRTPPAASSVRNRPAAPPVGSRRSRSARVVLGRSVGRSSVGCSAHKRWSPPCTCSRRACTEQSRARPRRRQPSEKERPASSSADRSRDERPPRAAPCGQPPTSESRAPDTWSDRSARDHRQRTGRKEVERRHRRRRRRQPPSSCMQRHLHHARQPLVAQACRADT